MLKIFGFLFVNFNLKNLVGRKNKKKFCNGNINKS